MIKCAGHTLTTCLTPVHSLVLKNHGRLSPNLNYTNLTKSRKLHSFHQKCQFQKESIMVATRYSPPWFRCYIRFSDLEIIFWICQLALLSFNCFALISSIAPMMDLTDNHYRTLARIISKHAWLYSEMIAAETIVFQKGNLVIASLHSFSFLFSKNTELLWSKYCIVLQEHHLMIFIFSMVTRIDSWHLVPSNIL